MSMSSKPDTLIFQMGQIFLTIKIEKSCKRIVSEVGLISNGQVMISKDHKNLLIAWRNSLIKIHKKIRIITGITSSTKNICWFESIVYVVFEAYTIVKIMVRGVKARLA